MLLIAYGVLPVSEIRKLGWRSNHLPEDVDDVLRRRSPERLGPIVDYLLDDVGTASSWHVVRPLVREGIVPRPDSPSYTIAMLRRRRVARGAVELLAEDPGLLDVEVWRLFEVEGGGEDSLANHEKFFGDTGATSFRELAARGPATPRAPARRQPRGARPRLLGVSRRLVLAVPRVARTDRRRARPPHRGVPRAAPEPGRTDGLVRGRGADPDRAGRVAWRLATSSTGSVRCCRRRRPGRRRPASTSSAARRHGHPATLGVPRLAAADALRHPSPDVQRAAIALIGKLVAGPDDAVAAAIEERLPEVAASQRAAAAALAARLGGSAVQAAAEAATRRAATGRDRPTAR